MNENHSMPEIDPEIPKTAVSVYGGDPMDDFPVLKAFQSYIDAEQAKARKRLLLLGIFFGALMVVVIAIFVGLLLSSAAKNQQLNDRLIEYVMKERSVQQPSSVVVNPQPDNTAILKLTEQIQEMQRKISESQTAMLEANRAREAVEAKLEESKKAAQKGPTEEEREIIRLKALLAREKELAKERQAAEKERLKQLELEVYRRKHYPELYETSKAPSEQPTARIEPTRQPKVNNQKIKKPEVNAAEIESSEDETLDDNDAIDYFKEEETPSARKNYSIPVDVRGSSSRWRIPKD